MIVLAAVLLVSGIILLGGAAHGLRHPIPEKIPVFIACGALAPDGHSACVQEVLHNGWCSDGQLDWHDDAWAVSAYDDTQQATAQAWSEDIVEIDLEPTIGVGGGVSRSPGRRINELVPAVLWKLWQLAATTVVVGALPAIFYLIGWIEIHRT